MKTSDTIQFKKNIAVDVLYQMEYKYFIKAKSHHCPLHNLPIFYTAGINSWILFKEIQKEKTNRKYFLLHLTEEL